MVHSIQLSYMHNNRVIRNFLLESNCLYYLRKCDFLEEYYEYVYIYIAIHNYHVAFVGGPFIYYFVRQN